MTASISGLGAHRFGILLVTASALVFSVTGVLTKAIESDAWTITCWRGLLGGALVLLYVAWRNRGRPMRQAFRLGWHGWMLAAVGSFASLAFIFAFKLTYVANVAVIYATAPFLAAGIARVLLGERCRAATLIAAAISLAGVAVVVAGGIGAGNLPGDVVALLMTLGNALYVVLIRRFKDTSVVLAGGVSGLQLFVVGCLVVDPFQVSHTDAILLMFFGLSFAIAVVLWTEGTRRLPAAQASLLGSAETPFAILLAWLVLAELPPAASFIGGAIVLAVVFAHAAWDLARPTPAR